MKEIPTTSEGASQVGPRRVIRFGVFQVNFAARELCKHGVRVRLPGQPFCILSVLLEKPGEIVTREEMRQRLWPSDTFVDFEHSLNSAIKKLRAALGDSPENSRYIETVPRVGYRFIAPVDHLQSSINSQQLAAADAKSSEQVSTLPAAIPVEVHRPATLRLAALGASLGAVILVAGASYRLISPRAPRLLRVTHLTRSGRVEPWAQIVTDGARIYFLEREGDHWNLMQTSVSGGESQPVAAPFRNTRIFDISPDHAEFLIAQFSARTGDLPLSIWPVQGGIPRRVGDVVVDDAVWCPDGKRILIAKRRDLFLVNRDGVGLQKFLSTAGVPSGLRWSPDGRRLRFTVLDEERLVSTMWEVSADGTDLHPFFPDRDQSAPHATGSWSPDGKYFLYMSRGSDLTNVFALRERSFFKHGKDPVQLTAGPTEFFSIAFIPGSHQALAYGFQPAAELVRYDVKSRQRTTVLPGAAPGRVVYCPNRKWVLSNQYPDFTLWRSRPDGNERLQLTFPPMRADSENWFPDGSEILFGCLWLGELGKICKVPEEGGNVKVLLSGTDSYGAPSISPDGQSFAYVLNQDASPQSGKHQGICLHDLKVGESSCLPHSEDFSWPKWSPDGHAILAETKDQRRVAVFDLRKRVWSDIARGTVLMGVGWSSDGQSVYFQDILEAGEPVYRYRAAVGKEQRVASFEEILRSGVQRCALSGVEPDGSLLLVLTRSYADIYALDLDLP